LSGFSYDNTGSAGFFVLDSMSYKSVEKTVSGLKDGRLDRYNDDSGFKYFLNMAYCYLIACNNSKGSDFRWVVVSTPFGNLDGTQSDDFPQFYLSVPSFIAQTNNNDCGFGALANSLALVRQFQDKPFLLSEMKKNLPSSGDYSLNSSYTLIPLWDSMIMSSQQGEWQMYTYADILPTFRKEFVVLTDCIAFAVDGIPLKLMLS
jgi:hypothetical protein